MCDRLKSESELVCYCNVILFKSVLNCVLNHVMCDRFKSELELVCYCNVILFKLSSEPHDVFMGSTFSELFYFYFQRAKKRKRKQGRGIVVVV